MALLVACACSELTEEHVRVVRKLISEKIDWNFVITYANYHKILPLLHRTLTTHFKSDVPDNALKRINILFNENSISSLIKSASLVNVVNLLNDNGIDVLPVKGPLLAERLYGAFAMRSYSDLDILIRRADAKKALKVLQENNYTLIPKGISELNYLRFLKYKYHGQLLDKNGVFIELHWELTGFYVSKPMTFEILEPFLISSKFSNCTTLDLSNEMLFLFLCIHGNRHRLGKIDYLCSISQLMNIATDIDWILVLELGKKHKMINRILVSLCVVEKFFGTAIPGKIKNMVSGNLLIERLADEVIAQINQDMDEAGRHPLQKNINYQLAIMDSKLDSIRFIIRTVVVPSHENWDKMKLPGIFFWFYFLYKPYRVLSVPIFSRINSNFKSRFRKIY